MTKTLTLIQPWATLVATGRKRYETRSWSTSYRGPLLIHAAKGMPGYAKDAAAEFEIDVETLPRGVVIARARLTDCIPTDSPRLAGALGTGVEGIEEWLMGDYSPGRFAWRLEDVEPVGPWPARGALGLWEFQEPSP